MLSKTQLLVLLSVNANMNSLVEKAILATSFQADSFSMELDLNGLVVFYESDHSLRFDALLRVLPNKQVTYQTQAMLFTG